MALRGFAYAGGIWTAMHFLQRKSFSEASKNPKIMAARILVGFAGFHLAYLSEWSQLVSRLSGASRSAMCDEICPYIQKYQGQYSTSDFEACEQYCRRKGVMEDLSASYRSSDPEQSPKIVNSPGWG